MPVKLIPNFVFLSGLITGDAYLGTLPMENKKPVFEFLLRQNFIIEGLNFSVREQDVILSLLIYDRYLNKQTGEKLLNYLMSKADHYDNILVEQYGVRWNVNE